MIIWDGSMLEAFISWLFHVYFVFILMYELTVVADGHELAGDGGIVARDSSPAKL